MSSATKTGPRVFYASWRDWAWVTAVHYVFSVATMVWFLSLEPSSAAVPPNEGIDTAVPATIDMAMSNVDLIEAVFRQGIVRVINAFARTGSACTEPEAKALEAGSLDRLLEEDVARVQKAADGARTQVENARKGLDVVTAQLAEITKKRDAARLVAREQPDNAKAVGQLKTLNEEHAQLVRDVRVASRKLKEDIKSAELARSNVSQTARSSAFIARSCNERHQEQLEAGWRDKLKAKLSVEMSCLTDEDSAAEVKRARGQAPAPASPPTYGQATAGDVPPKYQSGGRARGSRRQRGGAPKAGTRSAGKGTSGPTRGTPAKTEPPAPVSGKTKAAPVTEPPATAGPGALAGASQVEKTMQEEEEVVKDLTEDVALASKLVGCKVPFNPTTFPRMQGHINTALGVVGKYLKHLTPIDMDRRMMAGEFGDVAFGAAPLKAPPNKAPTAIVFALLRPVIYGILGVFFAGYLAYTVSSIPYAWLMNGIQGEWFPEPGAKMPLWKVWMDRIILFLTQLTVTFWTFPLWLILGGSVFWVAALVIFTPLAFLVFGQTDRPWHKTLYYALIAALPLSMLHMAVRGVYDLNSKLPKHSDVKEPATWAWCAWLALTGALGISAMAAEGADQSSRVLSTLAWVALVLLVALPPLAVLAES